MINFSYASGCCLSGYEIELQLNNRISQLAKINNKKLELFLINKLLLINEYLIKDLKIS